MSNLEPKHEHFKTFSSNFRVDPRRLCAAAAHFGAVGFGRAAAVLLARHEARITPVTVVMEVANAAE